MAQDAPPPTPPTWDQILRQTVLPAVRNALETTFHQCGIDDCQRRSLGNWAVCHLCSRRVCLNHGYLTLEAPPQVICVTCVLTDETAPRR